MTIIIFLIYSLVLKQLTSKIIYKCPFQRYYLNQVKYFTYELKIVLTKEKYSTWQFTLCLTFKNCFYINEISNWSLDNNCKDKETKLEFLLFCPSIIVNFKFQHKNMKYHRVGDTNCMQKKLEQLPIIMKLFLTVSMCNWHCERRRCQL